MTSKNMLKTFYTEAEEDGSFAIVIAKTLAEACILLAAQLEESSGHPVDPTTLSLSATNPHEPQLKTLIPPNARFDRSRFL